MPGIGIGIGLGLSMRRAASGATFTFRSGIGVNTALPSYYDPSKPYLNMAKAGGHGGKTTGATTYRSGRWVPYVNPSTFDAAVEYGVNSDGYPTSMSTADKLLYYIATVEALHPSGDYVIKWSGSPTLAVDGATSTHTITSSTSNRIEFEWDGGQLVLSLTAVGSPVLSGLVVCRAEDEAAIDAGELYRPEYLAMLSGHVAGGAIGCIRTMDLNSTNYSTDTTTLRPTTFISWCEAPPSVCARLALDLDTILWWSCPHTASDAYMDAAAAEIYGVLSSGGRGVVGEWSNENWNSIFASRAYSLTQGAALGLTDDEKIYRYQANRSLRLAEAFQDAGFTRGDDYWTVFAGWLASGTPFTTGLPYNDPTYGVCKDGVDFAAVAFYVGLMPSTPMQTSYILGVSPSTLLFNTTVSTVSHLGAVLASAITSLEARVAEADAYGLPLLGYEGGQHNVGIGAEVDNTSLTDLFIAMHEYPEMGTLYDDLLDAWAASGAWMIALYTSCSGHNKYGTWGHCSDSMDTDTTVYNTIAAHSATPWWSEEPPVPGAERILQTLETAADHAYGVVLMNGDYSGALAVVGRSSDGATMSVNADVDGRFDMAAVDAWAGSDNVDLRELKDQVGVNHITFPANHRPLLKTGGAWRLYGSASRLGLLGNGSGSVNATNTGYYGDTAADVSFGADSGYVHMYRRTSTATSTQIAGLQNKFENGAGFAGQWAADASYHRQDLSSATPSTSDTADRVGATDTSVGMKCVVGRRSSAAESSLHINGSQYGSVRTGIAAAGPSFSRFLGGNYNVMEGGASFGLITFSTARPTDVDIALLQSWFETEFPE